MFDGVGGATTVRLSAMLGALVGVSGEVEDAERVEQIRLLEQLKSAAAAAQARVITAFADSQRRAALAAGAGAERADRGIAQQIALARRISAHRAMREAGWARILRTELPSTFEALQRGVTSEWRAMLVARETACLSREQRRQVDRVLGPQLENLSDRRVEAEARRLGYALDPHGAVARLAAAGRDRRVSLRPAPDTMTRLSALLPVAQGVAAYAALLRAADTARCGGDPRGRGQLMADTLVQRLTGQARADDVPVEIALIMTDATLLAGAADPAELVDGGPLPAPLARQLAVGADASRAPRWLRRLYRHPQTGELAGMDSARRCFTPAQRRFVRLRDRHCRTPWCTAPIRHIDHVQAFHNGGATTLANAAGLCQACNYAKQAPGWSARPDPEQPSAVLITTPTGHAYRSTSPPPPGTAPPLHAAARAAV